MRGHCLERPRGDKEPSGASLKVAAAVAMRPRVKVRMRTKLGAVELDRGQERKQQQQQQQDSSPIVKSKVPQPKVARLEMRVAKVKQSADQKAANKMMVRDRLTLWALVAAICWQLVALSNCLVGGQFAPSLQTGANLPTLSSSETQIVRGLANWPGSRLELPCLVDQLNCGEVYYITWTKQVANQTIATATAQSQSRIGQQIVGAPASSKLPWSRVYLYTGANDSAPHKPIGDLQGRARFVMPEQGGVAVGRDNSQPMARLVIEEPRLSDEALYKCDVTYVKGKCPSISLVRVQMMALPERAQIFQVPSQRVDTPTLPRRPLTSGQMLGPLNEHDQLQLVCLVAGGRPAPLAVFWRKIDPTGRTTNLAPSIGFDSDQQQQQSRLTTTMSSNQHQPQVEVALNHTLTSADLGAKFECHVEHEALDGVVRPMARLLSATGADQQQQRRRPLEQNDALLDLHPAASSSINRHDSGAAETNSESSTSELLDSDPTTRSLDAHLTIDLNVGVQSLDLFVNKQQAAPRRAGSDLKEGDLIELECVAYDSKPAANITWLNGSEVIGSGAGGGELELGSARRSVGGAATGQRSQRNKRLLQRNLMQLNADGQTYNTHSFLSIKLSRHEHGAQISCQARNGAMRDSISKSIELQVQYAPIVLMEPANGRTIIEYEPRESTRPRPGGTSVITSSEQRATPATAPVASGQNQAQIYCIYSANPFQLAPSSTRWFKDGQLLSVTGERLAESSTQNGYPTLTINRVNRQDAGSYDCQLTNSVGTSERLAQSETSKLEVHFRPSVQMRAYKTSSSQDETLALEQNRNELDFERSLVMPNDEFELVCELLEANPNKIDKFHWFGSTLAQSQSGAEPILRLLATSDGPRFKLGPLKANFSASLFACAATNSIGQSELSNTIELELSHTPGVSNVRPITSPRLKKLILSGGKTNGVTLQTDPLVGDLDQHEPESSGRPISAGKELLLECVTRELGRPRANIWLWFRNGQTIGNESQSELRHEATAATAAAASHSDGVNENGDQEDESEGAPDNPISDRSRQDLSSSAAVWSGRGNSTASSRRQRKRRSIQLLASGRFLFIPSIQLAHKGNFSCVALNRLGPGGGGSQSLTGASAGGRDSFELRPAQAPSFVQPLAPSTNWAESASAAGGKAQLELVCRVQCEPICQLEWLRNNEPLDIKNANNDPNRNHNYVAYHVRNTIFDEHEQANQFRSVESRLVLTFDENLANNNNNNNNQQQQQPDKRPPLVVDRDWLLARRHFLNSSNFTCQSGHNSMGPPVRSTTKLVVQYPPENVLISAPSDKLNLVEGSRGPMLSCEASGEPQVQYRWLLLRSGAQLGSASVITSSDLVAARYNVKHSLGSNATGSSQQNNKKSNGALQANDRTGETTTTTTTTLADNNNNNQADGRLVQLTGLSEGEQVGGTSVSMLDLASISMDRKQSGHYICEASNGLGQTRQSIHVNVLYKPSCVTLHMHSLDLTALARPNLVFANRPNGQANKDEEYALVSESSDDFIGLRKLLVMSPLLASGILTREQNLDKFSLSASMFGTMLETAQAAKQHQQQQQHQLQRPPVRERPDGSSSLIPNGDLRDGGDSAQSSPIWSSPATASERPSGTPDAWAKFNDILVKFLNDYSKLIKLDEERRLRAGSSSASASDQPDQVERRRHDETTRRRSSVPVANDDLNSNEQAAPSNRLDDNQQPSGGVRRTNMLTFACMAQEANPMVNLTFEWYFGTVRLVATNQQVTSDFIDNSLEGSNEQTAASQHETTIYSNANETLSIVLTRRLDSGATLSPFQVSFITVNVVLNSTPASGIVRDGDDELQNGSSSAMSQTSAAPNGSLLLKAPVIRSRYQSFYQANLQANNLNGQAEQLRRRSSGNSKLGSNGQQQIESIEISEFNWRDRLAQLLSCSVSNSVGTSDACYVRPLDRNALKRRKQLDELNGASSSYELAKWRMPSLAQKSVLIISVLIGCSLIVFATFALLLGPHLRAMQLVQKKRHLDESAGNIHSNVSSSSTTSTKDQDQNTIHTANSTSSQKSSVLGLLGNAAEHSFPSGSSSSDDDSTTNRLNQLDSRQLARRAETRANHFDYDLPRNNSTATQEPKLVYQPDAGNFGQDQIGCYENYRFHYDNELQQQQQPSKSSASANSSAGGRILASLKSKFKVQDRIGDLPNGRWSGLLHARNVSNSETATTGLSLDKSFNVSATTTNSVNQHTTATLQSGRALQQSLGVPANLRHSYAGARPSHYRHLAAYKQQQQQHQPSLTMAKSGLHYPMATILTDQTSGSSGGFDEATYNRLLQLNSQVLIKQTMGNTMQNQQQQQQEPLNAMDEFMRRRGFDTTGGFEQDQLGETAIAYGTQSIRNKSSSIYALRNDLIQLTTTTSQLPAARAKPPVYPRASQSYGLTARSQQPQNYQISAMFKPTPPAPMVAARNGREHQMFDFRHQNSTFLEHNLTAPYSEPNTSLMQTATPQRFDTIDAHLNRFANNTLAYYNANGQFDQHQLAYANTLDLNQQAQFSQQRQFSAGLQSSLSTNKNQPIEHIYDTNAYATPEQTPARRPNATTANQPNVGRQDEANSESERLRVSQLIQTFNTKLPENSP